MLSRICILIVVAAPLLAAAAPFARAQSLFEESTVEIAAGSPPLINVSVFPGAAGYEGLNGPMASGTFGDGTVLDYRFFNNDGLIFNDLGYANGGTGVVAPATATNSSGLNGGAIDWADVWTTSDPAGSPADFTVDTIARSQGVTGTIDISGLEAGSVDFIYGTFTNPNSVTLTMSGAGQPDIMAQASADPVDGINTLYASTFLFGDASAYDTITYEYTNTDIDGSRARFLGVVVDDVEVALPVELVSTDFDGRTVSDATASDIIWETNGVETPGDLTAVPVGGGPFGGLFDTDNAQGHFAPDRNTDNEGPWSVDIPLNLLASELVVEEVELDWQFFNNGGSFQTANRTTEFTATLIGSDSGEIGSAAVTVTGISGLDSIRFSGGLTLTDTESYTLQIVADGVAPGNNTGLDGIRVLGTVSTGVIPEPGSLALWSLIACSCPGLVLRGRRAVRSALSSPRPQDATQNAPAA